MDGPLARPHFGRLQGSGWVRVAIFGCVRGWAAVRQALARFDKPSRAPYACRSNVCFGKAVGPWPELANRLNGWVTS